MLFGGVNYRLKADPERDVYVPWAGRVLFAPQTEGEGVKIQFYQVYLVCVLFTELVGVEIGLIGVVGSFGTVGKVIVRSD